MLKNGKWNQIQSQQQPDQNALLLKNEHFNIHGFHQQLINGRYHLVVNASVESDSDRLKKFLRAKTGGNNFSITCSSIYHSHATEVENMGEGIYNNVNNHGIYGTLGGILKVRDGSGDLYGISNNHVIANLNDASEGDPIHEIGHSNPYIGNLYSWFALNTPPKTNSFDAALFILNEDTEIILRHDQPLSAATPVVGSEVWKSGRETGITHGIIKSVKKTAKVVYDNKFTYLFNNLVLIQSMSSVAFSEKGDSGSLVLDRFNRAVGLVIAGTGNETLACRFDVIAKTWNLTFKL